MYSKVLLAWFTCLVCLTRSNATPACQKPSFVASIQACDPKPLIYDNEGCKECVYLDTKGIKTIGVGFNLRRQDAESILESVGANYNAIMSDSVTAVKTPCDCSKVTCLNHEQVSKIFDITIEGAINDARSVVSTFSSQCCPVQNAVVDMSFTLGKTTLITFKEFLYFLENQNWKACADDLRTTKWCQIQASRRCNADADAFQKGCGCTGAITRRCDVQASACCLEVQTCCKGTLTFKNYVTRTVEEQLCCPYANAKCCPDNKCCQPQYPICCLPNLCCAAGNRCISGQCYRDDGSRGESMPSTLTKPRIFY